MADWLLIATFGDEVRVIGVGDRPRNMVPLTTFLKRGSTLEQVNDVMRAATDSPGESTWTSPDGARLGIGVALRTFAGTLHGFAVWVSAKGDTPPPRPPAGAWQFNLTTNKISGSDELLDLYGVPRDPAVRRTERATAEAFERLVTNADESQALAKIVRANPGTTHTATWTVRRDDNQLRAAHFSCEMVAEATSDGLQVVLRGITHDIGPADTTPSAPPHVTVAQQVVAAMAHPGQYRALLNLRTMQLLRWVDDPMPGIAWEYTGDDKYWLHPDDYAVAQSMSDALAQESRAEGVLRFRSTDGSWRPLAAEMRLMLLDQHTTAALLTISDLPAATA